MSTRITGRLAWCMALAALLTGVIMAGRCFRERPTMKRHLIQKRKDYEQLDAMRTDLQAYHAARMAFDSLATKTPARLDTLAAEAFRLAPPTLTPIQTPQGDNAAPGWRIRRVKVNLEDKPLPASSIMQFIHLVERSGMDDQGNRTMPPWRLIDCRLWATPQKEGLVKATLTFEALEKIPDPSSP